MPNQSEIAERWGTSRQYVSKMVKLGCPTDTMEAAIKWRNENKRSRNAANGLSKKIEGKRKGKAGGRGKYKKAATEEKLPMPKAKPRPAATGDSLLDFRNQAIYAHERIAGLLDAAMSDPYGRRPLPPLIAIHNKASEARIKSERQYREELERRGNLIDKQEAFEEFRKGFDMLLKGLNEMAKACAQRANPQNPNVALLAIEQQAAVLVERAQKRYA